MHRFVSPLLLLFLSALPAPASRAENAEAVPVPVERLVAEIMQTNPELAFYREEILAAKAGQLDAGRRADPELSLEIGRKRVRDFNGTLAGEGTAWSVAVTQTFAWPGRAQLRKAIASRQVELAELGLAQFEAALAARARLLAFGLHAANTKAAAVREVASRFTALKETYLARDPAGIAPLLETRAIEANELSVQRRANEAELALQAALIELNQLRGLPADAPLRVAVEPVQWGDLPEPAELMAAARQNDFSFQLRLVELEQQGLEVRLARHERYPEVSVSPFYSQEKAGERETVVGLGLSVPLPVTSRTRSAAQVAESRQRQAETALLVAGRELERDVLRAAQAYATKVHLMRAWTEEPLERFGEAAALADRHYRLGAVPLSTYIELQVAYLDAVEVLLDTEQESLEAGLELQLLTGLTTDLIRPVRP